MAYQVLHNAIFQRVRERHAEINEKYHGNYSKKFEEGVIAQLSFAKIPCA